MNLTTGLTSTLTHVVTKENLASAWANDAAVLATPILLWLGELCCMKAIDHCLPSDEMTVGAAHNMQHLAATPLGFTVVFTAKLQMIDGKKLVFLVEGHDGYDLIYTGTHERFIVNKARFTKKINDKLAIKEQSN